LPLWTCLQLHHPCPPNPVAINVWLMALLGGRYYWNSLVSKFNFANLSFCCSISIIATFSSTLRPTRVQLVHNIW
jgi:hypothetical protein